MEKFKKIEGITLIALVITIIVMLILVGVTLNMINGENGILGKAERAVDATNEAMVKEEVEMAIAESMMGYYMDGYTEGKSLFKYMAEKLPDCDLASGATLECDEDGMITYTDKKGNQVIFQMDDNGQVEMTGKSSGGNVVDTAKPRVKVDSTTMNSITFTVTDGFGVVAYAVTESETAPNVDEEWTSIDSARRKQITVDGKAANKTYYIWAKDNAGNVSTGVKAVTSPLQYTVTYDENGGSGVPTDTNKYSQGTTVTVKFDPTPTKTGYAFMGWTDDASNKNTAKFTSSGTKTFEMGSANVTLYAVWQEKVTLKVGDTVSYSPSGTYTEWTNAHSGGDGSSYNYQYSLASGSSYTNSSTQTNMSITSWKVFKIDGNTVQLVPATVATPSLGLRGADGYNNSVKLLNEACSSLYGNSSKGITARSINIEDIEAVLDYDPTTYTNGNAYYGQQYTSNYTGSYKNYPKIYAQEKKAAIDTTTPATSGLGFSDEASSWITGTETASSYIRPVQTYYYLDNSNFSSKLKGITNGASGVSSYANLLLPSGSSTNYWVASRCVYLDSSICYFRVRYVNSGYLYAFGMYGSNGYASHDYRSLFPVVSLSSELIGRNASGGFVVK